MAILIPGHNMPAICQNCPCFNVVVAHEGQFPSHIGQVCRATGLTIKVQGYGEEYDDEWFNTSRPDFCPLVEIEESRPVHAFSFVYYPQTRTVEVMAQKEPR